jgi:thymidylate synthase
VSSSHETFADAYLSGLRAILKRGRRVGGVVDRTSVGSSFGEELRPTLEVGPHLFTIEDSTAALIEGGAREPSKGYIAGQWLWVMAGSDDLDRIAYYNGRGRAFSEDGNRLSGAFGARMRRSAGDQLGRTIGLLRRDPTTRRALIVFSEAADSRQPARDFPCAIGIQFLIRDGSLEAITTMRSQSALMVLPYDVSLMLALQLWVAAALELPPGRHHWVANSFHLYEDEIALARRVLEDPPRPRVLPCSGPEPERRLTVLQGYESDLCEALSSRAPARLPQPPQLVAHPDELHGAVAVMLRQYGQERLSEGRDAHAGAGA